MKDGQYGDSEEFRGFKRMQENTMDKMVHYFITSVTMTSYIIFVEQNVK